MLMDRPEPLPPINGDLDLLAKLKARQWNIVMAGLDELPHRVARDVIDTLGAQLQRQVARANMPPMPVPENASVAEPINPEAEDVSNKDNGKSKSEGTAAATKSTG